MYIEISRHAFYGKNEWKGRTRTKGGPLDTRVSFFTIKSDDDLQMSHPVRHGRSSWRSKTQWDSFRNTVTEATKLIPLVKWKLMLVHEEIRSDLMTHSSQSQFVLYTLSYFSCQLTSCHHFQNKTPKKSSLIIQYVGRLTSDHNPYEEIHHVPASHFFHLFWSLLPTYLSSSNHEIHFSPLRHENMDSLPTDWPQWMSRTVFKRVEDR